MSFCIFSFQLGSKRVLENFSVAMMLVNNHGASKAASLWLQKMYKQHILDWKK